MIKIGSYVKLSKECIDKMTDSDILYQKYQNSVGIIDIVFLKQENSIIYCVIWQNDGCKCLCDTKELVLLIDEVSNFYNYPVVEVEKGDDYCKANGEEYYYNFSSVSDEIVLGLYDNEELKILSLFHEIGHTIDKTHYRDDMYAYDYEKNAWDVAYIIAEKYGITFSDNAKKWAAEQLETYYGWELNEYTGIGMEKAAEILHKFDGDYKLAQQYILSENTGSSIDKSKNLLESYNYSYTKTILESPMMETDEDINICDEILRKCDYNYFKCLKKLNKISISEKIWNQDIVDELNTYQTKGEFHPYTCPNHKENHEELLATVCGWICPCCDYTQNWYHK